MKLSLFARSITEPLCSDNERPISMLHCSEAIEPAKARIFGKSEGCDFNPAVLGLGAAVGAGAANTKRVQIFSAEDGPLRMRWVAPAPPASNVPKCSCHDC